ncbi:acyl-CoA N-acyltransferase [Artomyces pyxidatus]|uniref:Acyl-CoA N-acyltransferase n=1 Tax=Artomyces pyxidatus TaxID=48021 RepID=A0ACB8STQ7_9AGAM|nr:acyl-CoA N-acyltransferase [Artomyces pyxidatus]
MFDTGRTILRPYKESDVKLLLDLWNDAESQGAIFIFAYPGPVREEFAKEMVEKMTKNSSFFALAFDKETDAFVGQVSLMTMSARNRGGNLGIALTKEWRGKGIGTEIVQWMTAYGFKELGLHRVSLGLVESNVRALAVYKKIGYKIEGRAREACWLNGKWENLVDMSILEQEWDMETGSIREEFQGREK